jgi:WD40 repeat protein
LNDPARLLCAVSVPTISLCSALFFAASLSGAEVSFSRDVAPILVEQCVECHREGKSKGGYRLDTFEALRIAGDSEAMPVVAGKPDTSELVRLLVIEDENDRMPKKGDPLTPAQIATLRQWIESGAKFDGPQSKAKLNTLFAQNQQVKESEKYPVPLPITALAASNDAKSLAISGFHEITLWDAQSGKLAGRIPGLPEKIQAMAWLADGKTLVVAGGRPLRTGEVWLVDVEQRKATKRIHQTTDTVLALAVSPDGKRLAIGGADNRVALFSLPDAKPLWNVEAHADWVTALAFSPDGTRLASASRDRTARLLSPADGHIEATHTGHETAVLSLTFLPNNKEILSGDAAGYVRHWDLLGDGKKDTTIRPGRAEILQLAMLDETPVVAMANGDVSSLDPKKRTTLDKLARHEDRVNVIQLVKTGEKTLLITGSHDGEVRVLDVKEKKELLRFVASPGFEKR